MGDGDWFDHVTVGLVTALPVECAAVRRMMDDASARRAPGDPNHYVTGTLPSSEPGRPHRVVVAMQARDGTRNAAAICTDMARSFPGLRVLVMCGIAAGVPGYRDPHPVRPGDLAIATKGIVDYAHVRAVDGTATLRRQLDGLSATLLRADRELQVDEKDGGRQWRAAQSTLHQRLPGSARPDGTGPVVHRGAVGSADILLRDAVLRDSLASAYDLCAFEMEGSGIAVGADLHERSWFVVRGISDTGDATKNDAWHDYAAGLAAAYARALLGICAPMGGAAPVAADALETIVETLLGLRLFRDDHQRRELIEHLPEHIRTAIPANRVDRLHVLALISTCQEYDDGLDALIGALRITMGSGSPEFRRVSAVVRTHWHRPRR